jgi:hypothetical protein
MELLELEVETQETVVRQETVEPAAELDMIINNQAQHWQHLSQQSAP